MIIILLLLGLCFGSFVNALVWRLHEQDRLKIKKAKPAHSGDASNLSILHGRSMCPHCKHPLAVRDLIPVLSWLQLRGKCRYCRQKFDDTPLSELLMPFLFIFSYLYWPLAFDNRGKVLFVFWLVFLVGFVAMIIYDTRWLLLPNKIIYPLLGLAVIQVLVLVTAYDSGSQVLKSSLFGLLIGGGIFYVLFQVSKGKWIGGGDVKLGAILGLIVGGPSMSLLLLFLASCFGTLVAMPLLITGKATRTSRLPFGPYLITATIVVYLFGAGLIAWYRRIVLI